MKLTFLGVGGASQIDLGHAAAVLEIDDKTLLIDCGPGTTRRFKERFKARLPDALFITHCHLDHISDFENLFIQCWFHQPQRHCPKVFVPAAIIPLLHQRVGTYPQVLAEGGVNFWDAFQLIPVHERFVFAGQEFQVLPVRHHAPNSAFGLRVPEAFFYTGDTRPIPELLQHQLKENEVIFHDCGRLPNPSHTGISDLFTDYPAALIERIHCYHYTSSDEEAAYTERGLKLVKAGQVFEFPAGAGSMKRRYKVVGHRGFPQQYPENSLIGIVAAAKLGADAIELDVQLSRDLVPMVFHDDTLQRVCQQPGNIWDYAAADLEKISCHEPLRFGERFNPCPLVRLDTLCKALGQFKGKLFVEIKEESFAVASRELFLDKVLEACRAIASQVEIISFDLEILRLAKARGCRIGWVISAWDEAHHLAARELAPEVMISDVKKLPSSGALWQGDWQWFVYDVVDPQLAQAYVERGIDYIETWDAQTLLDGRKF